MRWLVFIIALSFSNWVCAEASAQSFTADARSSMGNFDRMMNVSESEMDRIINQVLAEAGKVREKEADAGFLAAKDYDALNTNPQEPANASTDKADKPGDEFVKIGQVAGYMARDAINRLNSNMEVNANKRKIALLVSRVITTAGSAARRAGANPSQEGKAIGAALKGLPQNIQMIGPDTFEERIRAYIYERVSSLSPRDRGLLTGNAILGYDSNWEAAAAVAGKSVYESGGTWAEVESVIISIFKEYPF